jgi:hypothetical protein
MRGKSSRAHGVHGFLFCERPPAGNKTTRVLELPGNLSDKRQLLHWYGKALEFPTYYGANWDALSDCLRDLGWVPERLIHLHHAVLPLATVPSRDDLLVYLRLLLDVQQNWKSGEKHQVQISFAPQCRDELELLLAADNSNGAV